MAILLRLFVVIMITVSIGLTYYVVMIQKDYVIETNPNGPDTTDYFAE